MECLQLWYPPEKRYPRGEKNFKSCSNIFRFWLGGADPQTPRFWAGRAKTPQTPPLERLFVTFDPGGQTGPPRSNYFLFGAADDTRASRTSGQTPGPMPHLGCASPFLNGRFNFDFDLNFRFRFSISILTSIGFQCSFE